MKSVNKLKSGLLALTLTVIGLVFWTKSEWQAINENLIDKLNLPSSDRSVSLIIEKGQIDQQINLDDYEQVKPIYYSVTNLGITQVKPQVVVNGKDWFTDQAIVNDALKEIDRQKATSEEVSLAMLKFVINNRYHHEPPLYKVYQSIENPVQYFNSWGYGWCSDSALSLVQLLHLANYKARLVSIEDHLVGEVYYDEAWHMLDPDREVYYKNLKGEIASVKEIVNNNQLLNQPFFTGEKGVDVIPFTRKMQIEAFAKNARDYQPAKTLIDHQDYQNELVYRLRSNEEIRFYYDYQGKYYWGFKSKQPPEFTNGVLISGNNGGFYQFQLPYTILASYIHKPNLCKATIKVRFSLDGKDWKRVTNCQDDVLNLADLFPIGENSFPANKYYLTLPWSLDDYQIITQFQVAPKSIPKFNLGSNQIEMKKALKTDIKVEFGYLSN